MAVKDGSWGPEGFHVLKSVPRLYYKIEEDGGVLVTGTSPKQTVFHKDTYEGGKISGGIRMDGGSVTIFGTYNHNHRRKPVRWVSIHEAERMPPPKDRRNQPGEHPWKAEIKRVEEARAAEEKKKWAKEHVTKAVYQAVVDERNKLRQTVKEIERKVDKIRDMATKEVDGIRAEFLRRTKVRSVHLEATLTGSGQVEGHKTEHWEVGDKRYLVIAETPPGLGNGSWAEDITRALNKIGGVDDEVAVAIVPKDARVRVVELIPLGSDDDDLDDTGQF